MKDIIVGFTGTQKGMTSKQKKTFQKLIKDIQPKEFHHGDCLGADSEAHIYLQTMLPECAIIIHPPANPSARAFCVGKVTLAPEEYLTRDHLIADVSDLLIATPFEYDEKLRSGTWATIRYAKKTKTPIKIIFPDGKLRDVSGIVKRKKVAGNLPNVEQS